MKLSMPSLLLLVLLMNSCALFYPKDIGRNTVADLKDDIEELTSEDRIKGIVKSAVEGAFEGTATETSTHSIKELVDVLTEEIKSKLNPVLAELDTKTPAENLTNGAIDALTSDENKAKINALLTDILENADQDLKASVSSLEVSLNETVSGIVANLKSELADMDQTVAKVFSNVLQDSLSNLINGTIEGIDMEMISRRISTELLTKQLRDSINQIVKEASNSAVDPLDSTLDLLKKNLTSILLLIAGLVILIIYVRRRFVQKDHDMKHAQAFAKEMTKAVENLSTDGDTELETRIKKQLSDKDSYEKYRK